MLGVFFVIGLAFVLFFALVRSGSAAARWIGAALVCLVVLGMVGGREFAKLWHLRDYFTLAEWRVESSQGSFWMFAILLVAGIVVLLWALRLAFGSKPPESE